MVVINMQHIEKSDCEHLVRGDAAASQVCIVAVLLPPAAYRWCSE